MSSKFILFGLPWLFLYTSGITTQCLFGPTCKYACNCLQRATCDPMEGCPTGNCARGFDGPKCQRKNVALDMCNEQQPESYCVNLENDRNCFYASFAVDGTLKRKVDDWHSICCTYTGRAGSQSWTVHWDRTYGIYVIYNKDENYGYLLSEFQRQVGTPSKFRECYKDPTQTGSTDWIVMNHCKDNQSLFVNTVRIIKNTTGVLQLCEFILHACTAHRWGTDCDDQCFCAEDVSCNKISGRCPGGCAAGYTGSSCSHGCPDGLYGPDCVESCGNCLNGDTSCNKEDGNCDGGCAVGWRGDFCKQGCPDGLYGPDCVETCGNCLNGDTSCNKEDGNCDGGCAAGWRGYFCKQGCPDGLYGPDCVESCGNCLNGDTSCNKEDGHCDGGCAAGWRGDFCKQGCPDGLYGPDCVETCGNCLNGDTSCNKEVGNCDGGCAAGWRGDFCKQECENGSWGENCASRCSEYCMGGNTACNIINGTCGMGCLPGGLGERCVAEETTETPSPTTAIVGGVVGGIAVAAIVVVAVAVFLRRKKRQGNDKETDQVHVSNRQLQTNATDIQLPEYSNITRIVPKPPGSQRSCNQATEDETNYYNVINNEGDGVYNQYEHIPYKPSGSGQTEYETLVTSEGSSGNVTTKGEEKYVSKAINGEVGPTYYNIVTDGSKDTDAVNQYEDVPH